MLMLNDAVGEARHLRAYWAAAILEPGEAESIENFAQARNLNAAPFEDALVEVQTSMGWRTYPGHQQGPKQLSRGGLHRALGHPGHRVSP